MKLKIQSRSQWWKNHFLEKETKSPYDEEETERKVLYKVFVEKFTSYVDQTSFKDISTYFDLTSATLRVDRELAKEIFDKYERVVIELQRETEIGRETLNRYVVQYRNGNFSMSSINLGVENV